VSDVEPSLEELEGAESEGLDLMASRSSDVPPQADEEEDYEPTVLLQTPGLLEKVRGQVREAEAAEKRPGAEEEAPEAEEVSPDEDTPKFWPPEAVQAIEEATGEPTEEIVALTDEVEELLEEDLSSGRSATAAEEEIDEEAWRAQLETGATVQAPDAEEPGEAYGEEAYGEEESEERTLIGEEEFAGPFRFPAPPAPAPPRGVGARQQEAEPGEPGLAEAAEEAMPFEERLDAALDAGPSAEEPDLQAAPVGALELPPSEEDLEAVPFEEHLEARLVEASAEPVDGGTPELSCPSCGAAVAGVLAERLAELTEAVERLQAEVHELGARLHR
jgi:hypothetical protein